MKMIQIGGVISSRGSGEASVRNAKRLDRAYKVLEEFGHRPGPHISVIETDGESWPYPHAKVIWENS